MNQRIEIDTYLERLFRASWPDENKCLESQLDESQRSDNLLVIALSCNQMISQWASILEIAVSQAIEIEGKPQLKNRFYELMQVAQLSATQMQILVDAFAVFMQSSFPDYE